MSKESYNQGAQNALVLCASLVTAAADHEARNATDNSLKSDLCWYVKLGMSHPGLVSVGPHERRKHSASAAPLPPEPLRYQT